MLVPCPELLLERWESVQNQKDRRTDFSTLYQSLGSNGGFHWLLPSHPSHARLRPPRSGWRKTAGTAVPRIGLHWLIPRTAGGETARNSSMGGPRSLPFSHANGTRNSITG